MFPIRCTRGYQPLGDEPTPTGPSLATVMQQSSNDLKNAVVQAVIEQALFSTGIQVALIFCGPIGWAVSGLLSVTQQVLGKVYEKRTKAVIAATMSNINARAAQAQQRVSDAANAVYLQEVPNGVKLASNGQPLSGLGSNIFQKIGTIADKETHKIGTAIAVTLKSPQKTLKLVNYATPVGLVSLAVNRIETAAAFAAGAVGATSAANAIVKAKAQTSRVTNEATLLASPWSGIQTGAGLAVKYGTQALAVGLKAVGDNKDARGVTKIGNQFNQMMVNMQSALMPLGTYNLLSGRDEELAARNACADMQAKAYAMIDSGAATAIAQVQSPMGRQQMDVAIAQAFRNDPTFMQEVQELQRLQAGQLSMTQSDVNQLQSNLGITQTALPLATPPTVSSGTGVLAVIGIAAAGAGAWLLAR